MKGLKGDGHGGWYDAKGNFVAKTVNGKLVFTGGRGAKPPEDPNQQRLQHQIHQPQKKHHMRSLHLKRLQLQQPEVEGRW